MTLYIDRRECIGKTGGAYLDLRHVSPFDRMDVRTTTLQYGDVMHIGNGPVGAQRIGYELKSTSDLLSSIETGRLTSHQAPGMVKSYAVRHIVYYGEYRAQDGRWQDPNARVELPLSNGWPGWYSYGGMTIYRLQSALYAAQLAGFVVHHTATIEEAAAYIAARYAWWQKPYAAHRTFEAMHRSSDAASMMPRLALNDAQRVIFDVAVALPDVGPRKALTLATSFPSLSAMMNATRRQLQVKAKTKGPASKEASVGKVLADRIYTLIRQEATPQ